jgi:enoyl-CoA hydratase/carnithine racemase
VDQVVTPEDVVPKALDWCREILKMPPHAMHATRKALRADYATLFDSLGSTTRDEMTAVWFGAETQKALKDLVAQLTARKK